MIDSTMLRLQWQQAGYLVLPQFIESDTRMALRRICDRIYETTIDQHIAYRNATNIAYLTAPHYFTDVPDELKTLLEFIAHPQILSILSTLALAPVLFHNTQYFCQPCDRSWDGDWHRDTQFQTQTIAEEQRRMNNLTGVHFRVAFEFDDCLEYVPGSHSRWDTEAELAIRRGDRPSTPAMPNAVRIPLQPGDACVFHAWGIHRGTYQAKIPRRTFDIIYGWGGVADWAIPDPTCFPDAATLATLSAPAQLFYQHSIDAYHPYWNQIPADQRVD